MNGRTEGTGQGWWEARETGLALIRAREKKGPDQHPPAPDPDLALASTAGGVASFRAHT